MQSIAPKNAAAGSNDAGSVRVGIDKIDSLIDLVGELVITQAMLDQFREDFDPTRLALLQQGLAQLARHTRTLQESVMGIRMLPIGSVFNRFPRLVRDLSQKLGKQVKLEMVGENTELDKTVLEKIGDPLVHLVRNAIDHGLETPEKRRAAGKQESGTLRLEAFHRGGSIVVEIVDDGAGLNREAIVAKAVQKGLIPTGENLSDDAVNELIFQPGFSTAATTTDLSGRGVGMDVVRRNVVDLGGNVAITSHPGRGTTFTITLPLTLAIIDGLSAAVGNECYIVPLVSIVESVQLRADSVRSVIGGGELFRFRDAYLPIVRLHEQFGCVGARQHIEDGLVIVVEADTGRVGLFIDELIGQQQAVVKSLEANYRRVEGISGATVLADGSVALIIDVAGLVRMQSRRRAA
jgi:two-component system chemotaxis sensor kinase CheA